MNEIQTQRENESRDQKQPYARPELVRHGKVEDQTLGAVPIPSTSQQLD